MQPLKIMLRLWYIPLIFGLVGIASAHDEAPEAHKLIIQQSYDKVYNTGDFALMDVLYAEDYIHHGYGEDMTRDDLMAVISAMRAALPDFSVEVEVLIAQEDWAASRVIFSGTFENSWVMGDQTIEPNGEPVEWAANTLHRFNEDGQIAEDFVAVDMLNLLSQLDAAPVPPLFAALLVNFERTPAVTDDNIGSSDTAKLTRQTRSFTGVIEEAINNGDLAAIDVNMSATHRTHEPFGNFTRDQFKEVIRAFRATVPDLHVTIDGMVVEGNWLAARLIYTGTFSNDINLGVVKLEANDKPITFIINVFVHYDESGDSIEDFKEYNRLGWLRQLDLLPVTP